MEARYAALRRAAEEVAAVDAHAHNLVELASAFPFLRCFSEAEGDALALAPHSLSFKVRRPPPAPRSLSFKVRRPPPRLPAAPPNSVLSQLAATSVYCWVL